MNSTLLLMGIAIAPGDTWCASSSQDRLIRAARSPFRSPLSRFMKKFRLIPPASVLLLALFAELPAGAQRLAEYHGAGNMKCGEYLEDRGLNRSVSDVVQWANGYLAAYNFFAAHPQTKEVPSDSTILAYLDKHCRDNPLHRVAQGLNSLIGDLGGWRPKLKRSGQAKPVSP